MAGPTLPHTPLEAISRLIRDHGAQAVWDALVLGASESGGLIPTPLARDVDRYQDVLGDEADPVFGLGWCDGATELTKVLGP